MHAMPQRHHEYFSDDDPIPEQIYVDENLHPRANAYPPPGTGSTPRDVADALARKTIIDRDDAISRAQHAEAYAEELESQVRSNGDKLARCQVALVQRDEAVATAERAEALMHEALHERAEALDELDFTRELLADAAVRGQRACLRVRQLEDCIEKLLASAPSLEQVNGTQSLPPKEEDSAFGLNRTKEAIEKAVKDASSLPDEERRKKLRQLKV
jgi:hypothetical protein